MSKRHHIKEAWAKRNDVLVIDRRLDLYFFAVWFGFSGWGFTSAAVNTVILDMPISLYPTLWAASIGLAALIAAASIMASFFTDADQYKERIRQKRTEAAAAAVLFGLIAIHPIDQVLRFIFVDPPRPDSVILALTYLAHAAYRVDLQLRRAQAIRTADQRYLGGRRVDGSEEEEEGA